jgi:hypothetical protein
MIALTATLPPAAASPVAAGHVRVLAAPSTAATFTRATIAFTTPVVPENPFDPREVSYRLVAHGPGGRRLDVPAFWYQGFTRSLVGGVERLAPRGRPHWRVHLTPTAPGEWTWRLVGRDARGRVRSADHRLRAGPPRSPGFVRRSPHDDRHLVFDDGTPFAAVGENLAWPDARGTFAYDRWLAELAAAGGNLARIWMPSWAFGIEWSDTGLGDYRRRLDRAWQLDRVFRRAEQLGIRIQLVLLNHGAFSTVFNSEWSANPYNRANGGPLAHPAEFFTDRRARSLFGRRLRYVVARWGSYANLAAWELWNEVDLTDGFHGPTVAAWHREMAGRLRRLDAHDHLVTTSTAVFVVDEGLWSAAGLDLAQVHFYATFGGQPLLPNLFATVADLTAFRRRQARLPTLVGELGIAHRPDETTALDPGGIALHDGLWAGVVSDGFGTAMPWWWDSVTHADWDRYGPMFAAVARFVRGVRFDREELVLTAGSVLGAPPEVATRALVGRTTVLAWVKDQAFQWTAPVERDITTARVRLPLPPGRWCGAWHDTWDGRRRAATVHTGGGDTDLVVPPFRRDVAVRLHRCPAAA